MLSKRLCRPLLLVAFTVPSLFAANYTYTKITDNGPDFPGQFARFGGPFLINNQGVVAFEATYINSKGDMVPGIFTGSGSGITKLVDETVSIVVSGFNDSGTVVYLRGLQATTVAAGGAPFMVGQSLTGTVYPAINNAGTVVYGGQNTLMARTGSGAVQTLVSNTDLPRSNALSAPFISGVTINTAGTVAFIASGVTSGVSCNCGLFTKGQGAASLIAPGVNDNSPQINDNGAVAFYGNYSGKTAVFVASSGQVGAVVDVSGQVVSFANTSISLNKAGKLAYWAKFGISPFVQGIFTGPDKVADRVIANGDPLFGSVVSSIASSPISARFLNDNGQIAFGYTLSNGLSGVAVATPVASGTPPPTLNAGGIVNGASFSAESPFSPGSIISLFGDKFVSQLVVAPGDPLPTSLGGVTATINGIQAPLFFVAPGQINAQVPFGVTGTSATVQVNNAAGQSEIRTISIAPQSPAIFTANQTGVGQGVIVFGNTATIVGPVRDGTDWRPAKTGDTITIYINGLGAVTPPVNDGWNSCAQSICTPGLTNLTLRNTTVRPVVKIGNVTVPDNLVLFSGLAPEFAGLYQINVTIPPGITPSNSVPVLVTMGNVSSPPNLTMAMQ